MNQDRRQAALAVRRSAAELAAARPHPEHVANGDEQRFRDCGSPRPSYLASFTKGLCHNPKTGLVENPDHFQQFVRGIDSGDPQDFRDTPLGPGKGGFKSSKGRGAKVRAWESQAAGLAFDLEGPDAQAVTMPPAPRVGSDELTAEMGEVYAQALLRDVPFSEFDNCAERGKPDKDVDEWIDLLNDLPWFKRDDCCGLSDAEASRLRSAFTRQTVFRGITPGDDVGSYLSQFLLVGNTGINGRDAERSPADGLITYGAISVEQKVRRARPQEDHMQSWEEWLDVQNGANLSARENYEKKVGRRFIATPRDLATYVHYDALYEAYLNACLILLGNGAPFDPGIPFQLDDALDHQQGFAHFGGPHILSLVTEVATRALKAVRYQKFNVHRRLRPEALGGRLSKHKELGVAELSRMARTLKPILTRVQARNAQALSDAGEANSLGKQNFMLPMAFCEGSPMHPAYGAGHATVAGACVTILKAFFDHHQPLAVAIPKGGKEASADTAYAPKLDKSTQDATLEPKPVLDRDGNPAQLTVEGELNKLASNISIGRDWAGVHYFTDYIESLRMGERIAIGILQEQKLTYGENFSMTVPLYDGGEVRI
ncbi:MAG: vanadium-dependent haloperoxidase, partial [Planctomycetota bacterium]